MSLSYLEVHYIRRSHTPGIDLLPFSLYRWRSSSNLSFDTGRNYPSITSILSKSAVSKSNGSPKRGLSEVTHAPGTYRFSSSLFKKSSRSQLTGGHSTSYMILAFIVYSFLIVFSCPLRSYRHLIFDR